MIGVQQSLISSALLELHGVAISSITRKFVSASSLQKPLARPSVAHWVKLLLLMLAMMMMMLILVAICNWQPSDKKLLLSIGWCQKNARTDFCHHL